MIAYNNLDWRFWVYISEPKKNTTMQNFLDILDGKAFIWKEMAKYDIDSKRSALRLHYTSNSGFQVGASKLN